MALGSFWEAGIFKILGRIGHYSEGEITGSIMYCTCLSGKENTGYAIMLCNDDGNTVWGEGGCLLNEQKIYTGEEKRLGSGRSQTCTRNGYHYPPPPPTHTHNKKRMFTDLATRLEQHHQNLITNELINQILIQEIEGAVHWETRIPMQRRLC